MLKNTLFVVSQKSYLSLFLVIAACATAPETPKKPLISPAASQLLSREAYAGNWELESCRDGIQQAQLVTIEVQDQHLVLSRWQWKNDHKPLFTARIEPESQTIVNFTSKDMQNKNPVINRSTWTWLDKRIVGNIQWLPGPGDLRGNWSAAAMSQFYVDSRAPEKLTWARWGVSHSHHGKQDWDSECHYKKIQPFVRHPEDSDFDFRVKKAEKKQTVASIKN